MLLEWNEGMSVGVKIIDEEHKKLISFLNELHDAIECGRAKDILAQTLLNVMAYTTYHFKHEEEIFSQTDYPDKALHIEDHKGLLNKLLDIQAKLRIGNADDLSIDLMMFLKEWLIYHIQTTDMKYAPYVNKNSA